MSAVTVLQTRHLGDIEWDPANEIQLPYGLPGFESERRMIPVEIPAQRPLVFLQSVVNPDVCFVALPVRTIDPKFELVLSDDDRAALYIDERTTPAVGDDVLCLALLMPEGNSVKANLDAPIVINLHNSRCMQAFSAGQAGSYWLSAAGAWEQVCS